MSSSSQPGRVARAATRYRPGKAPNSAPAELSSTDESDEEQQKRRQERKARKERLREEPITDVARGTAALKNAQRRTAGVIIQSNDLGQQRKPVVMLQGVKIGRQKQEEIDSDEYETDTDESEAAGPSVASKPIFKKPGISSVPANTKKESSSEYETDSEGEKEEESEEDSRPMMLKPIFVSKKQRDTLRQPEDAVNGKIVTNSVKKEAAPEVEEVEEDAATIKARMQMEERRKQSHLLAAETIKRELAEKEHEEGQPDLSDTDGKDPEEEFSAWRIRELSRLKADREAALEKEAERAEVERRRAMPEAQRMAEDTARAQASRDAKKKERQEAAAGEGGGGDFMQKYYHKGSFFQDLDILKKRDYQAKTESAVDISMLPKVMQVRDYGKAGRSKYTHLSNEDTSRQQPDHRLKGLSGANQQPFQHQGAPGAGLSCFACGGPHLKRDCPTNQQSGREGRGTNSIPLRDRNQHHRRSRSPDRRQQSSSRYDR